MPRTSISVHLSAGALCVLPLAGAAASLEEALDGIAPDVKKWAVVCLVTERPDGAPEFAWHDYHGSSDALDFLAG